MPCITYSFFTSDIFLNIGQMCQLTVKVFCSEREKAQKKTLNILICGRIRREPSVKTAAQTFSVRFPFSAQRLGRFSKLFTQKNVEYKDENALKWITKKTQDVENCAYHDDFGWTVRLSN